METHREPQLRLRALALSRVILFGSVFGFYLALAPMAPRFFPTGDSALRVTVLWAVYGAVLVGSLAAALGYRLRLATVLVFIGHLTLFRLDHLVYAGWAYTLPLVLLIFLFVPMERGWVLLPTLASAIYLINNVFRLRAPVWRSGDALYFLLGNPIHSRVAFLDLASFHGAIRWLGQFGLAVEALGALLFLIPWIRVRRGVVLALIALHASLFLTTRVQLWSPFMIALVLPAWSPLPWDRGLRGYRSRSFAVCAAFFLLISVWNIGLKDWALKAENFSFLSPTFYPTVNLLFQRPRPVSRYQVTVFSAEGGKPEPLYRTPENQAKPSGLVLIDDRISSAFEKAQLREPGADYFCPILGSLFIPKHSAYLIRYEWDEGRSMHRQTDRPLSCEAEKR